MKLRGYTLVELIIIISITGILLSFGISAYGKARDRQIGQTAGEQIVAILQENQTIASVGKHDCSGKYSGQQVKIESPNILKINSLCGVTQGAEKTISIDNIVFLESPTLIFNPLSLGINLDTSDPLLLNYSSSSSMNYRLRITKSGTIENQGIQP